MKLMVIGRINEHFILEIDVSQTILQLKKAIKNHYNGEYTGFDILNGSEIIDSSKNFLTLDQCRFKRSIRLIGSFAAAGGI